jgi:hypothetical protein
MWAFSPGNYAEWVSDPAPDAPSTETSSEVPVTAETPGGHLIRQAEVPPLDVDGVQAATVGTIAFAIATVIMTLGRERLVAAGDGWWLGVAVSGLGLGVIALGYTINRRRRRRREEPPGAAPPPAGTRPDRPAASPASTPDRPPADS